MKINVSTVDNQTITIDVDPNDLVGNVKALLKVERRHDFLFNGKKMNNDVKLSELGVQDRDLIVVVSESAPISGSSTTELGVNPDGSATKLAAFQQEIRNNTNLVAQLAQSDPEFAQAIADDDHYRLESLLRQRHQQREQRDGELGITNIQNVPRNGEGEVCLAFLAEKEMLSQSSEQEPIGANNKVNEEVRIQTNGSCTDGEENNHALNSSGNESSTAFIQKMGSGDHNDSDHFASSEHVDANMLLANHSKQTEVTNSELLDSSLSPSISSPLSPNPPQTTIKGHGLKKWRRFRREYTKDPGSNLDSAKALKRGPANISDMEKPNDSSVSSTNALVKSPGHTDLFSNPAPSSTYNVVFGTTFSTGADDSEDRSSKSSTAASAPQYKHEVVKAAGYHHREKHRGKNVSGENLHSSGQRYPLGKGHTQVDASKKPRAETIGVDQENSLSSMESDSRSYSSVFLRGSSSVNSDQVQSGRSANYDEEDADDQQASEVQSSEEHQADHGKNGDLSPDHSVELSCSANVRKSNNHEVSRDCEPLVNSILMLQSAQEALEREVQMFKEIGKGVHSLCDDSGMTTCLSAYSMFAGPKASVGRNSGLDAEINRVQTLEKQLEEAKLCLKAKDLKLTGLEKMIKSMNMMSPQTDGRTTIEIQCKLWQEMEAEQESIFKLKIETEIQILVLTGSRKDLSDLIEEQIKLLRDQNLEQSQRLIAEAGNTGCILQGHAKVDNLYTNITDDDEIQKMQSRMSKYRSYLLIQLVLLALVVGVFLLRVLPKSATVVPT